MKVIVISGPTATGKSEIAIKLAHQFGGEIVNFDSLLFYNEINIANAKPTVSEMDKIPHHMINIRSVSNPMNAAEYARETLPIIEKILKTNKPVYLAGGSGFYLQAILKGMYESITTPLDIAKKSDDLYKKLGIEIFRDALKEFDIESFQRYHPNDHYRIRRAVEHYWTTGIAFSKSRLQKNQSNSTLDSPTIHPWKVLHIYLDLPKEDHLKIIKNRTEKMFEFGLLDEAHNLLQNGFTGQEKPLQSIGLKEAIDFINGKYKTIEQCKEKIIISTRQLAKAQRTWFKKDEFKINFNPLEQRNEIFAQVEKFLKN